MQQSAHYLYSNGGGYSRDVNGQRFANLPQFIQIRKEMNMSSELLAGISGVVLSLLFEYLPGLHDWYNALVDAK